VSIGKRDKGPTNGQVKEDVEKMGYGSFPLKNENKRTAKGKTGKMGANSKISKKQPSLWITTLKKNREQKKDSKQKGKGPSERSQPTI